MRTSYVRTQQAWRDMETDGMNMQERVMTAVHNCTPDLVPTVEPAIDDAVMQRIMPGHRLSG